MRVTRGASGGRLHLAKLWKGLAWRVGQPVSVVPRGAALSAFHEVQLESMARSAGRIGQRAVVHLHRKEERGLRPAPCHALPRMLRVMFRLYTQGRG